MSEINGNNARSNVIDNMVEEIRQGEHEEQQNEQEGGEEFERPSIGKSIKPQEPDSRKKYTPIRARNTYKELLRATAKSMAYLEHVTNRRAIYNVDDERDALSDLSQHSYRAMKYIEEKKKEHESTKEQGATPGNEKNDKEKTRKKV